MKKYKNKYRIDSARLKNYDYSSKGAYFLTIVTKDRNYFFGDIVNENMVLSETGKIVQQYWNEISNQFSFIRLDEMIIMPNHIHLILWIVGRDAINRVSTTNGGITKNHNPMFHKNISRVIRWYKGRCTFEINKLSLDIKFGWQTRFHDRIIRDFDELQRIRNYIIKNPENWSSDRNK